MNTDTNNNLKKMIRCNYRCRTPTCIRYRDTTKFKECPCFIAQSL